MFRRVFALSVLLAFAATAQAQTQDYPNRLIKLLHGFPAGGNVDTIGRLMTNEMAKGLGQPFVVDIRPGRAGSLATEAVATATPDGYTITIVPSSHAAIGAIYKNLKYRTVEDFAWISTVSFYPFVLSVRKDSKYRSLSKIIAAARAGATAVSYGSGGTGSILHMAAELLGSMTGVKFMHVPYRGEAPAITGLLTGDVDFVMSTPTPAIPHIQSGALRALGVTSKARWQRLPDTPTFQEGGIAGYEVISWMGFAAPAATPRPIVDRLNAEIRRALTVPEVRAKLDALGGEPTATTPEEMRDLVARQLAVWVKVAAESKIQVD